MNRAVAIPPPLRVAVYLAAAVTAGCGVGGGPRAAPSPLGPPRVQIGVVRKHARQFDSKDPQRPAGSQAEFIAASYLLAHLEVAGYQVQLDSVPVGKLIHSTNVIALAPSGGASTVVVVGYDTGASAPSDGPALGTFLELARALKVLAPGHNVEFAALGAEHSTLLGGEIGSRSLVELLRQQPSAPQIVRIGEVETSTGSSRLSAAGPAASSIRAQAARLHLHLSVGGASPDDAFTRAGFPETVVGGSTSIGPVLLAYLGSVSPK